MAIFFKGIIFATILILATVSAEEIESNTIGLTSANSIKDAEEILPTNGNYVAEQVDSVSNTLGLAGTDSTKDADETEITTVESTADQGVVDVDLTIEGTTLEEAIKIHNSSNGFVRMYPAGTLEKLLKEVPAQVIRIPLTAVKEAVKIVTDVNETTTLEPSTPTETEHIDLLQENVTTTLSPKTEPTTLSPKPEPTTLSPKPETTTGSSEPETTTGSSEPETTTGTWEPETTTSPEPVPSTTPKPTKAPHHGLTRGEIAALVIFIIILFGVASFALIYFIRRRRMRDEAYTQLVR